ncbi:MAG: hypothetical protein MMC33_010352 [Icmadophila ericetorum]|nr:hypothetical protein [Icmadophila ericetorum]
MATGPVITPEEIAYQEAHINDDRTPGIIGGSIVLIVIATTTVVLRLVSRKIRSDRVRRKTYQIDDYLIIIALILAWAMFIALMFCCHYGMGKHVLRVGLTSAFRYARSTYVLEAIYPACTTATKFSILLLYRRVFTTHNFHFRIALYIISTVLIGWAIAGFFTTVFQCWPVHVAWDRMGGSCINIAAALIGLAVINTTINASILILPMPMVWALNMPYKQKIGICLIFLIGCGDVVSSIIRTWLTATANLTSIDVTWFEVDPLTLAFVEPCLGIICACLPVMRPFFQWAFSGVFGMSRFTGNKFVDESTPAATGVSRLSSNGYARQHSYIRDHGGQDMEMSADIDGDMPEGR